MKIIGVEKLIEGVYYVEFETELGGEGRYLPAIDELDAYNKFMEWWDERNSVP